ncbi:MAG: diphosphomevalonate decarboxylase [Proteobacteria bacterium]|nr:diphosphomevalonate decarboxylase [Pseudomonadota bacterium]
MIKKIEVVKEILSKLNKVPIVDNESAFAPTNIALCKYWGKRNSEINLPVTSSLSISLGDQGATTTVSEIAGQEQIEFNGQKIDVNSPFAVRLTAFLDLFRPTPATRYQIKTEMNIPVAAGLASSACGFAALTLALDRLYGWNLPPEKLSILARLGSGSAARSIWHGFVEWQAGKAENGMDSHGLLLPIAWPELRVGLHLLDSRQKSISSREAMKRTVLTSVLYSAWPQQVQNDMEAIKQALHEQDFMHLGQVAEANALAMHATMHSAWPPVMYSLPETVAAMHKVWQLRSEGLAVFFTQDAGPNLKLLFLASNQQAVTSAFPNLKICQPFKDMSGIADGK